MKQRWLHRVNKFLATYQTCHIGASIGRVQGFRTLHKVRITFSSVARYDMGSRLAADSHSSPSHAPKQAGNTRATCRGIVAEAAANPPAHKRMAGKFVLDVFGGLGFLAKASNHSFEVTKPLVLTRILASFPSYSSASSANLLHRARRPWILGHPCGSWFCDVPKIQTLAAQPRTAWALSGYCIFRSHHSEENEHYFWLVMCTAEIDTVLFASVSGQKTCSSKFFRITLKVLLFT